MTARSPLDLAIRLLGQPIEEQFIPNTHTHTLRIPFTEMFSSSRFPLWLEITGPVLHLFVLLLFVLSVIVYVFSFPFCPGFLLRESHTCAPAPGFRPAISHPHVLHGCSESSKASHSDGPAMEVKQDFQGPHSEPSLMDASS